MLTGQRGEEQEQEQEQDQEQEHEQGQEEKNKEKTRTRRGGEEMARSGKGKCGLVMKLSSFFSYCVWVI